MGGKRAYIKPAAHLQQGTLLRAQEHLLLCGRKDRGGVDAAGLPLTGSLPYVFLQKAVIKVGLCQLQPTETMATLRAHRGVYLTKHEYRRYEQQRPFEGNSPRQTHISAFFLTNAVSWPASRYCATAAQDCRTRTHGGRRYHPGTLFQQPQCSTLGR